MPAAGRENRELVLEDEGPPPDDVVDYEKALEGDYAVSGAVEAVHEGGDDGGCGGARGLAEEEEGGEGVVIGRGGRRVGGGAEDGEADG